MGPVANRGKGDLPQDPSKPALEDRILYERSNQLPYLLVSSLYLFAHPLPSVHPDSKAETLHALNGDTGRPPCGPSKVHHGWQRENEMPRCSERWPPPPQRRVVVLCLGITSSACVIRSHGEHVRSHYEGSMECRNRLNNYSQLRHSRGVIGCSVECLRKPLHPFKTQLAGNVRSAKQLSKLLTPVLHRLLSPAAACWGSTGSGGEQGEAREKKTHHHRCSSQKFVCRGSLDLICLHM